MTEPRTKAGRDMLANHGYSRPVSAEWIRAIEDEARALHMTRRTYLDDHGYHLIWIGEDDIPRSAAILGYVAAAIVILFLAWLFTVLFVLVGTPA